jgi:hypothetical protein
MLVLFYYSFIVLVYYKIIVITINYVNKLFQLLPIINLFTLGFLRSEFKAIKFNIALLLLSQQCDVLVFV